MRFAGNISVQLNSKQDVFAGENKGIATAFNYTGAWAFMYGVGCDGTFSMYAPALSTAPLPRDNDYQVYPNAGALIGNSRTVKRNPLFVDARHTEWAGSGAERSNATAGAGGSNLRLQAGSTARGIVTVKPWTPKYDLDGAVRTGGATAAAGAYV